MKGDLVTNSHIIMAWWRNYVSQLLDLRGINDVTQREIRTAEPLVPEPSTFELEMAIEKLKRYKSQGTDQIPAELIKAWYKKFALRSINLSVLLGKRRNCLRSGRSRSLYLFISTAMKHVVIFIEEYRCCQLHTKFYPASCCEG